METLEIVFWVTVIILMILAIMVPLILGTRKKAKKKTMKTDASLTKKVGAFVTGAPPINTKDEHMTTIDEESDFQVKFDPELKNEIYCYKTEFKCRVNFFSRKGTVAIYKIWQHVGGERRTRMKIMDGKTKKVIDGGWSETNVFSVKKNDMKGVFLVFRRNISPIEEYDVDHVGVKIETSEGTIIKDFKIRWIR